MSALKPPAHLSAEAKKLFSRLQQSLDFRLAEHHILVLAEYCETHLECVAIRKQIAREGRTIKINAGKTLGKHPLWDPLNQLANQQYRWAVQLGIAPHSEAAGKLERAEEPEEETGLNAALKAAQRGGK